MATPTYIVRKIGDSYIPVRHESQPRAAVVCDLIWGVLLIGLSKRLMGLLGLTVLVTGITLFARGIFGREWLATIAALRKARRAADRPRQTPSYQNDFHRQSTQAPADLVDEQSMESFPASDPPARTATALPK